MPNNTKMPERIWVSHALARAHNAIQPGDCEHEYLRADLAASQIVQARAEGLRQAAEIVSSLNPRQFNDGSGDPDTKWMLEHAASMIRAELDRIGPAGPDLSNSNSVEFDGIKQERDDKANTVAAIIGAMAFGYDGRKPPEPGHWLREFHDRGAEFAVVEKERDHLRALLWEAAQHGPDFIFSGQCPEHVADWIKRAYAASRPKDWAQEIIAAAHHQDRAYPPDMDGPDVPDGHDREGFPGGCRRFGCSGGDACTAQREPAPESPAPCQFCGGTGKTQIAHDLLARPPKEQAKYMATVASMTSKCPMCGGNGKAPESPAPAEDWQEAKRLVLERWPNAECLLAGTHSHVIRRYASVKYFGTGPTEPDAWIDAASKLDSGV